MATQIEQGGASALSTFDPAAWLADWSDHGGIVMHIGDRLWVGRMPGLDRSAAQRLDAIRGKIMHPHAAQALSGALRGLRASGEDA